MGFSGQRAKADSTTPLLSPDQESRSYTEFPQAPVLKAHDDVPTEKSSISPRLQILLLCYARLMEPMAFYSIFPYIAQMVQHNGNLPEADIGFYSGLFESLFSVAQALVLIFWGAMADRVGGKTMLVYSLIGTTLGTTLFGFATSLWQMALFRCFTGMVSGGNIIIRTMISERCTADTRTQAFSWYSFAGNVALFIGPLIGGSLASPASQYPSLFKGAIFFEQYPFALPGITVGALSATCAIIVALFIDDTSDDALPTEKPGLDWGLIYKLLKAPGVGSMLSIFLHVMVVGCAFMAVGNLALYTGVRHGGLGFSANQIALYMALQGVSEAVWILFVFPPLHRRLGTRGIVYAGAIVFPLFFAGYIATNAFLRNGSETAIFLYHIVLGAMTFLGPAVFMVMTTVQLGLQEVAPSPRSLGTLNAIAETGYNIVKAVIPAVSTPIFAIGASEQILYGYLSWVILIFLGGSLSLTALIFPRRNI